MAKTISTYHLHELLSEIRASEGAPEKLSTEAQLWDEIFKKEAFLMPNQMFPLIREVHGKGYPTGTTIRPLATEFSVERVATKEISSIRADITILVGQQDIYHFECQIENDGTMVLRMFEYDVHLALNYPVSSGDSFQLRFPHSAVLYLQDNHHTPKELVCQIQFQDGSVHEYTVPTLRVQSYSLEEIRQKHLCVLIPFLPLRFRKRMKKDKISAKNNFQLEKEELTSFYQHLILILDEEVAEGYLTENNRNTILSLLNKSMIRVFYQDETLIKEVIEMTEPILELEIEKYIRANDEALRRLEDAQQTLEHTNLELVNAQQTLEHKNLELVNAQQSLEHTNLELSFYKEESAKSKEENTKDKELIASLQQQIVALQQQLSS